MKKLLFFLVAYFIGVSLFAQSDSVKMIHIDERASESIVKKPPLVIVDSIAYAMDSVKNINPENIATVTVLKDSSATALYGKEGENGVLIIETKIAARKKYINFLRASSKEYNSLFLRSGNDALFQYILNGKVLTKNYEGELSGLPNQKLVDIQILEKKQLKENYDIDNKNYGIVIYSEKKEK